MKLAAGTVAIAIRRSILMWLWSESTPQYDSVQLAGPSAHAIPLTFIPRRSCHRRDEDALPDAQSHPRFNINSRLLKPGGLRVVSAACMTHQLGGCSKDPCFVTAQNVELEHQITAPRASRVGDRKHEHRAQKAGFILRGHPECDL